MKKTNPCPIPTEELWALSNALLETGEKENHENVGLKTRVIEFIDLVRGALWPQVFGRGELIREPSPIVVSDRLEQAATLLPEMLTGIDPNYPEPEKVTAAFLQKLPAIKALLQTDVLAAYEGDPAARNMQEIMLSYPAFEAISIYRLAHQLFVMQVPLIPRMMTEYAHRLTGVDIHPGATIGSHFFIDHGTGVVIGETTTIGDHVKLYQGVTLGAKSFDLDENGNPVKGVKRHPDIGSNVVIYSGATILGGNTVIGDNCVIGGNVWLTHSVAPGERVLAAQEIRTR